MRVSEQFSVYVTIFGLFSVHFLGHVTRNIRRNIKTGYVTPNRETQQGRGFQGVT